MTQRFKFDEKAYYLTTSIHNFTKSTPQKAGYPPFSGLERHKVTIGQLDHLLEVLDQVKSIAHPKPDNVYEIEMPTAG